VFQDQHRQCPKLIHNRCAFSLYKIEDLFGSVAQFAAINSPTAGPKEERELPAGSAPIQLYSLATPNGQKASILLEELGVDYDAHVINIRQGDQFTSGFVNVNPNSKIPAAVDKDGPGGKPMHLFESASIMIYFAEKYKKFYPTDFRLRTEINNWIFWQMAGFGPMSGNFGHFFVYAPPEKIDARNYGVARYGMEVQRLCSVLDRHLQGRQWMVGDDYTIADMAVFTWFNTLRKGYKHTSGVTACDFLSVEQYKNAVAWADKISERPAVQRGLVTCGFSGVAKPWLVPK